LNKTVGVSNDLAVTKVKHQYLNG